MAAVDTKGGAAGAAGDGSGTIPDASAAGAVDIAAMPRLSLDILGTVLTTRLQNGLRHGDNRRYRQYTARKLRRLRAAKAVRFTHGTMTAKGNKHEFSQRVMTASDVTDPRHLEILLFNAERAWAYASELKAQAASDEKFAPRRQYHMMRRLRRAAQWAATLKTLCHDRGDDRTSVEAEAYSAEMWGNYYFVRENWAGASKAFTRAKEIYTPLAHAAGPREREMFTTKVDSDINPALRWCNHQLSLTEGGDADDEEDLQMHMPSELLRAKLEAMRAESRRKNAGKLASVEWRGHELPVPSEELRLKVLTAQEASAETAAARLDTTNDFDAVDALYIEQLSALDDASRELATQKLEALKAEQTVLAEQIANLDNYVKNCRLEAVVVHQLWLISSTAARLATYEAVADGSKAAEALDTAAELAALHTTALRTVQEPVDSVTVAEARELNARAAGLLADRCLYLSKYYAGARKFAEGHALCERGLEHAAAAAAKVAEVSAAGGPPAIGAGIAPSDEVVETTARNLRAQRAVLRARGVEAGAVKDAKLARQLKAASKQADDEAPAGVYLMERLDKYQKGAIAPMPPRLDGAPCKPMHFDLAFAEMAFPDISKRGRPARADKPRKPKPAKKAPAAEAPAGAGAGAGAASAASKESGSGSGSGGGGGGGGGGSAVAAAPAAAAGGAAGGEAGGGGKTKGDKKAAKRAAAKAEREAAAKKKEEEDRAKAEGGSWLGGWFGS